jgi:Fe-S cluster biosynthesis and repair protein YggX
LRKNLEKFEKKFREKSKKGIDKHFFGVYYPTSKGKDVFERMVSETSFSFIKKDTIWVKKARASFMCRKSTVKEFLAFSNWKEWRYEKCIGIFWM